ncbi:MULTISPECIES: type III secretion system chaperone family protein [Hydrogenophaga]|uniref:Tir chaperone family protein n=2 Tax=Hydrogenophaga TaxID=47420 RepID=A0A1L1PG45_HYDIT|nr:MULTISPECIES: CesT family type III secretion system chaperone [Hydrogenophaga]AOS77514.1 hypothetical protein Q5W_00240 [Hydrogenophaga sp. PBC]TMU74084.1 type III secretion system chaperone [Hydrogenophaga intermedia]CDN86749.1 hypothetical protein BN948_01157 [Hydrogenophaga intermedia]
MDEPTAHELLSRLLSALSEALPANQPLVPPDGNAPFFHEFRWESYPVQLLCPLAIAPVHVTVACPLGPVPERDAETALRQLLRVNHLIATSGSTTAYEPADGTLYVLHTRPLTAVSAVMLIETMASLVTVARGWRDAGFLDGTGKFLLQSKPMDMAFAGLRA